MRNQPIYPVAFGSPQRDSFTPAVARAEGRVSWVRDLGFPHPAAARVDLLVLDSGDAVLVAYGELMSLYASDGTLMWTRHKRLNSPPAVAQGRVYFESGGMALEAVDAEGNQVLSEAPLPGVVSAETHLTLLWPRSDDFVTVVETPDPTYDEEDELAAVVEPDITACRCVYGNRTGTVCKPLAGQTTLPSLFVPERNRWLVAQGEVSSIDMTDRKSSAAALHIPIALDATTTWSADASATLVVCGVQGGNKTVVAVDVDGQELWRWVDDDVSDAWVPGQPPLRGRLGQVFVLTEGRVLAIVDGRLGWTFDARSEALRHGALADGGSFEVRNGRLLSTATLRYGTALGDGTLLVVGNKTLRHLDANGRKIFAVTLPDDILSPPVVDSEGGIYVTTATQLIKIS